MAISSPITAEGRAAIIENSNSGYLRLPATRRITQIGTFNFRTTRQPYADQCSLSFAPGYSVTLPMPKSFE
jgi:hypothetical protein